MNLKKNLLKSTLIIILLVLIISVGPMVEKVKAELANTPWPMFHHDLKHTGQSPYLGAQDNNRKWSYTTGDAILSSPAIGSDGTIYVGSYDKKLYAINKDGTLKWSYATGSYIESSPAIGIDGTIYVGSYDHKLYAINPDGTLKWSYTTGGYIYSSPAIGSDGTIYVGSDDHKLYAINPDGTSKWSYTTGGYIESSPAIGSDGTIYVGSYNKNLYAINQNGTSKWSYTTGAIIISSPAIGSDGTIYVGSFDDKLYAIGTITITFDTVPSNSGTITFDGVSYSDGDSVSKPPNTYNISANPATGYKFVKWEVEGCITVDDPNSPNITCSVSGNGTIHVEFEVDSTCFFDTKSGARIYIDLVTSLAPRWRVVIPSKGYDTEWMSFKRYTKTNNHFWGEYADTRYHFIIDFYSSGRYHIIFDDRVTRISIKIAN